MDIDTGEAPAQQLQPSADHQDLIAQANAAHHRYKQNITDDFEGLVVTIKVLAADRKLALDRAAVRVGGRVETGSKYYKREIEDIIADPDRTYYQCMSPTTRKNLMGLGDELDEFVDWYTNVVTADQKEAWRSPDVLHGHYRQRHKTPSPPDQRNDRRTPLQRVEDERAEDVIKLTSDNEALRKEVEALRNGQPAPASATQEPTQPSAHVEPEPAPASAAQEPDYDQLAMAIEVLLERNDPTSVLLEVIHQAAAVIEEAGEENKVVVVREFVRLVGGADVVRKYLEAL